jgi:putative endonuclease
MSVVRPARPRRPEAGQGRGRAAVGRRAEVVAALWLMAKGYRILGFRLATPLGEIDLLAQRGGVLAVVEVKSRTSLEAALEAVTYEQRERLRRAGAHIAAHRRPARRRGPPGPDRPGPGRRRATSPTPGVDGQ